MPDFASVVALPLRKRIERDPAALHSVIIDLDPDAKPGEAYARVQDLVAQALKSVRDRTEQHLLSRTDDVHPAVKARLQSTVILELVRLDRQNPPGPVITGIRRDVDDGRVFNPDNMMRSVISIPMLDAIGDDEDTVHSVVIEVNANYAGGRAAAKQRAADLAREAIAQTGGLPGNQFVSDWKTGTSETYVYAKLTGRAIRYLVERDQHATPDPAVQATADEEPKKDWRAIYHVWPDFRIRAQIWRSVATVKADACRRAFASTGRGIVWAARFGYPG